MENITTENPADVSPLAEQSGALFRQAEFVISAFAIDQLPDTGLAEIAFAGRSNVGKSSLINKLLGRRSLVKVSSRPGKTQSLNYFLVDDYFYLVDLPGYGFAKVAQQLKKQWQSLITPYLESRRVLRCVVVIVDLRHELKTLDSDLVQWLRAKKIPVLMVYTKADKLSRNQVQSQAAQLDRGFGLKAGQRVIFSAKTGEGRDLLITRLNGFLGGPQPLSNVK